MNDNKTIIISKLNDFICNDLLKDDEVQLAPDEPLFSNGMIDSFAIAQLGVFIEIEFNVYIPDGKLTVESMDTINQITNYILTAKKIISE